jgi:hypothetical protein
MEVLAKRLAEKGPVDRRSGVLSVGLAKGVIHVDPRGICWSTLDPGDEILPAIPAMLEVQKEKKPLKELAELYFQGANSRGKTVVRLSTRVESSTLWKGLRASGECGLTPDEFAVTLFLLRQAIGECELVTDYPTDGSIMKIYGRRRYFVSRIGANEAGSTLRQTGKRNSRNSYIPMDGVLIFDNLTIPSKQELSSLLASLGEWCPFLPV